MYTYSIYKTIIDDSCRIQNLYFRHLSKKLLVSNKHRLNVQFTYSIFLAVSITVLVTWFCVLLLVSGDIHPNPGPLSSLSIVMIALHQETVLFLVLRLSLPIYHLFIITYRVFFNKLDVLFAELSDFDILAFSETWLHSAISTADLQLQSYHSPERKDRVSDNHGDVIIYVKDTLFYRRRNDLEPLGIECLG